MSKNHAIIFDRDNTIILDRGYTYKVEELKWLNGAKSFLKRLYRRGFKIFLATNQGGIALNKFCVNEMHEFHKEMDRQLNVSGGVFQGIVYCPHHPRSKNIERRYCWCRKPKAGMLTKILKKYKLVSSNVVYVGDRSTDQKSALSAGIKFLRAPGAYEKKFEEALYRKLLRIE